MKELKVVKGNTELVHQQDASVQLLRATDDLERGSYRIPIHSLRHKSSAHTAGLLSLLMERTSFLPVLAIMTVLMASTCAAQEKTLFAGEHFLDSCAVELPLTYAKKDKDRYVQAARFLDDQELVYLTYDKKLGKGLYTRVYVVVETAKDSGEFVYLETTENHLRMGGIKQAFFPKFKARTERFYNADCFDRTVLAHPELKAAAVPQP